MVCYRLEWIMVVLVTGVDNVMLQTGVGIGMLWTVVDHGMNIYWSG